MEGSKVSFSTEVYDDETQVGVGTHQRFAIDTERFLKRLARIAARHRPESAFGANYQSCSLSLIIVNMPILDANTFEFFSRSPEQTRRVGMRLGALLESGDVISLDGDLGAGKTTLVQGLAAGWGTTDPVSSPTFVLVNVYRRSDEQRFAHLDAYRLSGPMEADDLDLDALIADGPLVVEWAPRIQEALPDERLNIYMEYVQEEHRQMNITAKGKRYEYLMEKLKDSIFGGA